MTKLKWLSGVGVALLSGVSVVARQPAGGQGGFVPADQLPSVEQVPAAPLLIAAYAFVWLAVFFYVWTVWRRLNKVETEMRALDERQRARGSRR